jgi:hypothetical protein
MNLNRCKLFIEIYLIKARFINKPVELIEQAVAEITPHVGEKDIRLSHLSPPTFVVCFIAFWRVSPNQRYT